MTDDVADFWRDRIGRERRPPVTADTTVWADSPYTGIDVHELSFLGSHQDRIAGWVLRPANARPDAVVVQYPGYWGGRGNPDEWLVYPAAGLTTVVMDVRGQGGATPDPHASLPHSPGFLTDGIDDPDQSYYVRAFVDAVRCVDAALELTGAERVGVGGFSQGGALALAAAALHPSVDRVVVDSPYLCSIAASARLAEEGPYLELAALLSRAPEREDAVLAGARSIDLVTLAELGATAPLMLSSGGRDPVCPPGGIEELADAWRGPVGMRRFDYRGHVLPRGSYLGEQLDFLRLADPGAA